MITGIGISSCFTFFMNRLSCLGTLSKVRSNSDTTSLGILETNKCTCIKKFTSFEGSQPKVMHHTTVSIPYSGKGLNVLMSMWIQHVFTKRPLTYTSISSINCFGMSSCLHVPVYIWWYFQNLREKQRVDSGCPPDGFEFAGIVVSV